MDLAWVVNHISFDFFNLLPVESVLSGYNACFFCAGVSSLGMKEPEYTRITYDLTMIFAQTLCKLNTDMTFCYVSGAGTDSSEKGRMMWARVKGKTENDLMKLPFKGVYAFRPALHALFPQYFGTLSDVGLAMINCALSEAERRVLEAKDITVLAKH